MMTPRQLLSWREVVDRETVRAEVHLTESVRLAFAEQKNYAPVVKRLRNIFE